MSEGIVIAIITGILTLTGTIVTVMSGMNKTSNKIEVSLAELTTKIEQLEKAVDKINDITVQIADLKARVKTLEDKL